MCLSNLMRHKEDRSVDKHITKSVTTVDAWSSYLGVWGWDWQSSLDFPSWKSNCFSVEMSSSDGTYHQSHVVTSTLFLYSWNIKPTISWYAFICYLKIVLNTWLYFKLPRNSKNTWCAWVIYVLPLLNREGKKKGNSCGVKVDGQLPTLML